MGFFVVFQLKFSANNRNTNYYNDFHIHIVVWIFCNIKKKAMKSNYVFGFSTFNLELNTHFDLAIGEDTFGRLLFRARPDLSNPVCSPCFRTSTSVKTQKAAFAFGVPSYIYEFYLYTRNSTILYLTQVNWFWKHSANWADDFHFRPNLLPTCPLRLVIPNNTNPPHLTAVAGTGNTHSSYMKKTMNLVF